MHQKLKLLKKAFKAGVPTFMEEINSSSSLETHLNAYLMGTGMDGKRPSKSGFMLIGAYNAASLRGRSQLSPAVKSRSVMCQLGEYTKDDLMKILRNKAKDAVTDEWIQSLVEQFLQQQAQAKRYHTEIPTFRDLCRVFGEKLESLKQDLSAAGGLTNVRFHKTRLWRHNQCCKPIRQPCKKK